MFNSSFKNFFSKNSKKSILVVEDDLLVVDVYRAKLEKEDYKINVVFDGNQAIEYVKANPPVDLVMLDLMLPGASGFDVLSEIRKNPKWHSVPVVVLSNLGQEEDVKKCKDLGISDYLIKTNHKISDITEKIKNYL